MNLNDPYKKINWIYNMPVLLQNNVASTKRLDSFSEDVQKELIYMIVTTLSEYFSQIPDRNAEISRLDENYSAKFVKSLSNTLPIWLNGLCDLTILQIVNGLLDILNLKTEYQKWPPKSVMEFYAVCKKERSISHEFIKKNNSKQIVDFEKEKKSNEIARKHLTEIFKKLGKNYDAEERRKEANI